MRNGPNNPPDTRADLIKIPEGYDNRVAFGFGDRLPYPQCIKCHAHLSGLRVILWKNNVPEFRCPECV